MRFIQTIQRLLPLALTVSLVLVAAPTFAQESAPAATVPIQPSLLVGGVGEVQIKPDTAYLSLGVVSRGKEATAAAQQNAAKTDAVIKILIKNGIAVADVHTEDYSLDAEYVQKNGASVFTGYAVRNTVRVVVRKIGNAGKVIDAALGAGANSVDNLTFGLADPEKARDEARTKAIADATRKARIAAKAAGVEALRFMELVTDSSAGRGAAYYYEYSARRSRSAELGTPTGIYGGRETISANVTVRFAIINHAPVVAPGSAP